MPNEAQTSQNAGETANDISDIMGGMSAGAKPETEPNENGGDAGQGKSAEDSGKGSEVQHPAWMNQINSELMGDAEKAGKLSKFEKLSDLASAYLEVEDKLGSSIVKPGEESSDEEREAFYRSLGKPESAEKYSIKGEEAKLFRDIAYKNNLTDEQAKALYSSLQEIGKNAMAQQQTAFNQMAKDTQNSLQQEYGKDYPSKIEMLKRGVKNYGGEAVGAKLQKAGLLADLDVVKMFIRLGEESSEAGSSIKTQGQANGYKSIANGGTLDFGGIFDKK